MVPGWPHVCNKAAARYREGTWTGKKCQTSTYCFRSDRRVFAFDAIALSSLPRAKPLGFRKASPRLRGRRVNNGSDIFCPRRREFALLKPCRSGQGTQAHSLGRASRRILRSGRRVILKRFTLTKNGPGAYTPGPFFHLLASDAAGTRGCLRHCRRADAESPDRARSGSPSHQWLCRCRCCHRGGCW